MKIDLIDRSMQPAETCGEAAAFCKGIFNPDLNQVMRSLNTSLEAGHEGISEFAHFTIRVTGVSRALSHQLVRHRLFSYAQVSQRHCNPSGFITPMSIANNPAMLRKYNIGMEYIVTLYDELCENGIPLEDARFVLPNATETGLFVGGNAREWKHFFDERCCNRAQWEIQQLAEGIQNLLIEVSPEIFITRYPICNKCPEPCGKPINKS